MPSCIIFGKFILNRSPEVHFSFGTRWEGPPPPLQRSPVPHTVNMILSCKAGRREHVCGFAFIFMRLVSWTTGSSPSPEDCFIFDVWPDSLCLSKSKGVARSATIWNIVYIDKQNWVCKYLSCSQESLRNSSELAALVPLDRCDWVQDINPWRRTTMGPVCLSFSKETGSSYLLGGNSSITKTVIRFLKIFA